MHCIFYFFFFTAIAKAVGNVKVLSKSSTLVELTWDKVSSASGYRVSLAKQFLSTFFSSVLCIFMLHCQTSIFMYEIIIDLYFRRYIMKRQVQEKDGCHLQVPTRM